MAKLKPELVPVEIRKIGNKYESLLSDKRFQKSVEVIQINDNRYDLRIWECGIGDYHKTLGGVTEKGAHRIAESKLRELIQKSI